MLHKENETELKENPRTINEHNGHSNSSKSSTTLHKENETELKENPFTFDMSAPLRPPRQSPGTSKLATENYPSNTPPKLERQISETTTAIKKIQASLQRTFSRKGKDPSTMGDALSGNTNDGFVGDDSMDSVCIISNFSEIYFNKSLLKKSLHIIVVLFNCEFHCFNSKHQNVK